MVPFARLIHAKIFVAVGYGLFDVVILGSRASCVSSCSTPDRSPLLPANAEVVEQS
jgi:hypothetical protein